MTMPILIEIVQLWVSRFLCAVYINDRGIRDTYKGCRYLLPFRWNGRTLLSALGAIVAITAAVVLLVRRVSGRIDSRDFRAVAVVLLIRRRVGSGVSWGQRVPVATHVGGLSRRCNGAEDAADRQVVLLLLLRSNGDIGRRIVVEIIAQFEGFDGGQQLFGQARQAFHVLRRVACAMATALRRVGDAMHNLHNRIGRLELLGCHLVDTFNFTTLAFHD